MSNIIYYFSGTGNSMMVAREIAGKLGDTQIAPIARMCMADVEKHDAIGLVFPVYYIHAPEIVLRHLKEVQFREHQRVFSVAVHGGSWGYALSDVRCELVNSHGRHIQEFRVWMPGNYILKYGALPGGLQNFIIRKTTKKLDAIAEAIRQNRAAGPVAPNLIARMFKKQGDVLNTFGEMGAKFHARPDRCDQCRRCQRICPAQNIRLTDGLPVWGDRCQQCMACVQWCPRDAITHPDITPGRKRYTCPGVTYGQLFGDSLNPDHVQDDREHG